MRIIRIDLIFSYWIFLWFIFYIFGLTNLNPVFAIEIGIIYNAFMLLLMLIYNTSTAHIIYFIIVNTFIKLLPFYYLRHEKIRIIDIYSTIGLFICFVIWLHINNESLTGNSKLIYESLIYGKNKTPFIALLEKIYKNL